MITLNWYSFQNLSQQQLYALLQLRAEVFVVEQNCVYQDLDDQDQLALHLLGTEQDKVVAYLRLIPQSGNTLKFGRLVTAPAVRSKGYGKKLMQELLDYCAKNFAASPIHCSAQFYLKKFYEGFGFCAEGDVYDEDGIPHIAMHRDTKV